MTDEQVILEARFDPKVRVYWYLQGMIVHFVLMSAFVGFFTLPIWVVLGPFVVATRYNRLSCVLTDRSIHLRAGAWSRVEKTIPLEQIQDLSLRTGPILDAFGIASVQIETAGGQAGPGGGDMLLTGLVDARAFRDTVLARRSALRRGEGAASSGESMLEVLVDIRDSLRRLEARLPPTPGA